ncbi:hypothetical protein ACLQ2M_41360, partial [Streptomyces sp. DT7]
YIGVWGPHSAGAKTHVHRGKSESFYFLSGDLELGKGAYSVSGGEGDFLHCSFWQADALLMTARTGEATEL